MDTQFNIGAELVQRLEQYFEQNESTMDVVAEGEISEIILLLPDNLKFELTYFVNKESIEKIPFL